MMYHKWAIWLHRYLSWSPIQRCMIYGKWFWAGWSLASWDDYCSKDCAEIDMDFIEEHPT